MSAPYRSYMAVNFWTTIIVVGANLMGAALTFTYYAYIDPVPQGEQAVSVPKAYSMLISIIGTLILVAGGAYLNSRSERYHPQWYKKIEAGEVTDSMPDIARQELINYPFASAFSAFAMWILAGLFFGFLTGSGAIATGFFRIFGVGGIMATAITFFAIEWLWRPIISYCIPDGKLSCLKAIRLPVLQRLIVVFFLIGSYPSALLSMVALSRGRLLLTADNPETVYNNLVIAVIFIVIVNALAGIGMAFLVTRSIVSPLEELTQAMSRVEGNDFDASVPVVSKDELGYVSEKFNDMTRGLKRGELLRNLLNLYVSPEVAREALEHGAHLGGQMVECSVLFSDIRGFTTISEQLSPDVLMDLLNRYMFTMVDVIVSNGGMVNKFGGDSLLAVFGTPLNPSQDHARNAVKTALAMRGALAKFNQSQIESHQIELKIGIGIATGNVVVGNIGGQGRIEYTVIGDTVNLAARLQSMSKELNYGILLNAEAYTRAGIDMQIDAHEIPNVNVRGKIEPVTVYGL